MQTLEDDQRVEKIEKEVDMLKESTALFNRLEQTRLEEWTKRDKEFHELRQRYSYMLLCYEELLRKITILENATRVL